MVPAETDAPSGTVTFLFTDIEDSTGLWEREPVGMQAALAVHDRLVQDLVAGHGGYVFAATLDGFAAAFDRPESAMEAAIAAQGAIGEHDWPLAGGPIRVRMGLHTGTAVERDGNYFGPAVNLAARVMGTAAGGQVLVSAACAGLLSSAVMDVELEPAGRLALAGIAHPVDVHVVVAEGLVTEVATAADGPRRSAADLPRYSTSFVGRTAEMSGLAEELGRSGLVTVVGAGGMGKTRLVVETPTS